MKADRDNLLLYAVTDRSWLGQSTLYEDVKKSLDGGVTFLQLREKELDREDFLKEAFELKALAREYKVPFVIDDDVELAKECDADGVHIGQDDMGPLKAREILGQGKIIGVSAQTPEQAIKAEAEGADYLGVGAVFSTSTKDDADDVSHETLKKICESVNIPVIAIGGITKENIGELAGTGIVGVAVVSAIYAEDDIKNAAEVLRERILKVVKE